MSNQSVSQAVNQSARIQFVNEMNVSVSSKGFSFSVPQSVSCLNQLADHSQSVHNQCGNECVSQSVRSATKSISQSHQQLTLLHLFATLAHIGLQLTVLRHNLKSKRIIILLIITLFIGNIFAEI